MVEPKFTPGEAEELAAMMNALDAHGENPEVPQDIRELLRNVKRRKGDTADEQRGQEVLPEPGFVVKTADDKGRKVFLNICGSAKVDAPGGFVDGKMPEDVQRTLERVQADARALSDQELQTLRMPLSCAPPRADLDHKAEPCTTIDVVFHLDVIKQAATHRSLKYFIINVAMEWVRHKFGPVLDPKFKLPKMKYKGEAVQPQMIRTETKALVKEIGEVLEDPVFPLVTKKRPPPKPPAAAAPAAPSLSDPAAQPSHQPHVAAAMAAASTSQASSHPGAVSAGLALAHTIAFEGKPVDTIVVTVDIPAALSDWQQVEVQRRAQEVQVSISGYQPLQVTVPFAVAAQGATATLGPGSLTLHLPVCSLRSVVQQLRRESPHTPGSIQLANSTRYELEV